MKSILLQSIRVCFAVLLCAFSTNNLAAQITTPEEHVGFAVGADRQLFGWPTVVEYFSSIAAQSDRIVVQELGKSTQGRPFIMAVISSPFNIANLAKFKNLQKQAAQPAHLSEGDARQLADENKVVVMITLNIHSTEIASSQESLELAYKLVTDQSPEVQKILDNVIILLIPSLNPDGMQMVVEWYNRYKDTPYEGSRPPFPYHPYSDHDNNRDWFMMNLVETRLVSEQLYHEWCPEIILDQHQMWSGSARLFLPPYADPVNPNLHPLLHAQMNKIGKHIVSELQAGDFKGIVTDAFFTAWWQGTSVMTPWWHNQIGLLSEVASVNIATPLFYPEGSLTGRGRGLPEYSQRMNFLDPWPGGWWRLRDIIDYEMAVTFSLLSLAADERSSVIYNYIRMNQDAITAGQQERPYAYVVPVRQHDAITAKQMLNILTLGGVQVHKFVEDVIISGRQYQRDDHVILLAQPCRPYIKDLFEAQHYPNLSSTDDGTQLQPYDVTGWTLPLMMGVESNPIAGPIEVPLTKVTSFRPPEGTYLKLYDGGYFIEPVSNRSFVLVNKLLSQNKEVYRFKESVELRELSFPPGTIYIPGNRLKDEEAVTLAQSFSVNITEAPLDTLQRAVFALDEIKLGVYQPWQVNADEAWTRLILEQFEFPFEKLHNSDFRSNKIDDYDAIIIPDMTADVILEGRPKRDKDSFSPKLPEGYRGGIGEQGVKHLREFIEKGGTLIVLNRACDFAIEQFGLPARNVLKDISRDQFFCPGSLLRIKVNNGEPLAYGMPEEAIAMFAYGPALRPIPWQRPSSVAAWYPDHSVLASGWMNGEQHLAGLSAVLQIPFAEGSVVLMGIKAQNRAQMHGTYKFLFNAIQLSAAKEEMLPRD